MPVAYKNNNQDNVDREKEIAAHINDLCLLVYIDL